MHNESISGNPTRAACTLGGLVDLPARAGPDCRLTTASRYVAGELSSAAHAAYTQHLATCTACAAAVRAQRALDALVPRLPTYRAPSEPRRLAPRLAHTTPRRHARSRVSRIAGAGTLAAALTLFVWWGTSRSRGGAGPAGGEVSFALVRAAYAATPALFGDPGLPQGDAPHASGRPSNRPDPRWARVPWLGFWVCEPGVAPAVEGVYVCALQRRGPLGQAGVGAGDVLLAVAGTRVRDADEMFHVLARHAVGDTITVVVHRSAGAVTRLGEATRSGTAATRDARVVVVLAPRTSLSGVPGRELALSAALLADADRAGAGAANPFTVFAAVPAPPKSPVRLPGSQARAASDSVPPLLEGVTVRRAVDTATWRGLRLLGAQPYPFGPGGLRRGDTLVAIDGRRLTSWTAFFEAYGADTGRVRTLHMIRAGHPTEVRLQMVR